MKIRRPDRTTQLAFAAAAAWGVVVLAYAVSFATDLIDYGDVDDWNQVFSDIPALAVFVLVPVAAFVLSILLSYRLSRGKGTPRDHGFAIALLAPGLVWVALVVFEYLV